MSRNARLKSKRVSTQATELAFAVPQVIAHRVARMMLAGPNPSTTDRREFHLMNSEKLAAFNESWRAMAAQMFVAQQQFALSLLHTWCTPWLGGMPTLGRHTRQWQSAALGVVAKGMAPVHKRAVANAKRLGRISRR